MVKRKSYGAGTGLFNAGTVVWAPYKGTQWPAVISRIYASQKKATYKFLPVNDEEGVFNAPFSKIKPFLLKDQMPDDKDEKLQAAYKAALEEVKKQRLEKGESLEDPEDDANSEEQSSETARKRMAKLDEKPELRKIGQKEFEVGDIVLVSHIGYSDWPALVLALRKRDVGCNFFPLKTGQLVWYRRSACQEFNVDQKTFTAIRKREATIERQVALDEAWELMSNTTKEERRDRYKQQREAMEKENKVNDISEPNTSQPVVKSDVEENDGARASASVQHNGNKAEKNSNPLKSSSDYKECSLEDERMETPAPESTPAPEETTENMEGCFEPDVKRKKVFKKGLSELQERLKEYFESINEENPAISDFDEAMNEFLKEYPFEKRRKNGAESDVCSTDAVPDKEEACSTDAVPDKEEACSIDPVPDKEEACSVDAVPDKEEVLDRTPQPVEEKEDSEVSLDVAQEETVVAEEEIIVAEEETVVCDEESEADAPVEILVAELINRVAEEVAGDKSKESKAQELVEDSMDMDEEVDVDVQN